ncbi:MAG: hypothetical protein JXX28_08130 [Deltaproteobacteria bacterium]|nr:hypothetical protein [Deltaproteobacteria bacterium]
MVFLALSALQIAHATTPASAESLLNPDASPYALRLSGELGALLPVAHSIQFSHDGTDFDYVKDGGQDNLFFVTRLSADLDLGPRHTVTLLYQPLDLRTAALLERDLIVDEGVFAGGSRVDLRYGFSFYRASWLYDLQEEDGRELALGISLQVRNASISFSSWDGSVYRQNNDIGPVPILKLRLRQPLGDRGLWWGAEADGFYAPIKYINGSDSDVVGAILDASGRLGVELSHGIDGFVNLRYLGGGATGTESRHQGPGDGYVSNWLHLSSLTLGFTVR